MLRFVVVEFLLVIALYLQKYIVPLQWNLFEPTPVYSESLGLVCDVVKIDATLHGPNVTEEPPDPDPPEQRWIASHQNTWSSSSRRDSRSSRVVVVVGVVVVGVVVVVVVECRVE